jgi:hypothetical protein
VRLTYLDWAVVNKQTVQLLEGLTSAIRLAEDNVGNSTTLRVRSIGDLDLLDRTNGLNKVLLRNRWVS